MIKSFIKSFLIEQQENRYDKHTEQERSIQRNIINNILQSYFFPLITFVYISRIWQPESVGKLISQILIFTS